MLGRGSRKRFRFGVARSFPVEKGDWREKALCCGVKMSRKMPLLPSDVYEPAEFHCEFCTVFGCLYFRREPWISRHLFSVFLFR